MAGSRVSRADMLDRLSAPAEGPHSASNAYRNRAWFDPRPLVGLECIDHEERHTAEGACREITGRAPG